MTREEIHLGLVFGFGLDYYRDIVRGIKSFAEARPRWIFTPIAPEAAAVAAIAPSRLDGVIAQIIDRDLADALIALKRPLVNVSGVLPDLPLPRVGVDHAAVGRQAAEHLLDRGLRHFGFVGYPEHAFSTGREAGFRATIGRAGLAVATYAQRDATRWESSGQWRWDEGLKGWLEALPKPVGVFASHDLQGVQLSEASRRAGLRVPEEVALIGVDDDDLLCALARPPLSSVALPAERIGFEAARLIDRLIARPRARPPRGPILLPPVGVATRASSDLVAIADAEVARALRFIREHAHEPIQVGDVLGAVAVSRRSLERRFRAATGRSPWQEIRRAHLERARAILAATERPMSEVAADAGFGEAKNLSVVFRRETGLTPTEYRRRHRGRP